MNNNKIKIEINTHERFNLCCHEDYKILSIVENLTALAILHDFLTETNEKLVKALESTAVTCAIQGQINDVGDKIADKYIEYLLECEASYESAAKSICDYAEDFLDRPTKVYANELRSQIFRRVS